MGKKKVWKLMRGSEERHKKMVEIRERWERGKEVEIKLKEGRRQSEIT